MSGWNPTTSHRRSALSEKFQGKKRHPPGMAETNVLHQYLEVDPNMTAQQGASTCTLPVDNSFLAVLCHRYSICGEHTSKVSFYIVFASHRAGKMPSPDAENTSSPSRIPGHALVCLPAVGSLSVGGFLPVILPIALAPTDTLPGPT